MAQQHSSHLTSARTLKVVALLVSFIVLGPSLVIIPLFTISWNNGKIGEKVLLFLLVAFTASLAILIIYFILIALRRFTQKQ